MPQPSPYTPGEVAKTVPGRTAQLAFYEERAQLFAMLGRFIGRVRVDHAARGVGKTSLLRAAQRRFEKYDIATVWVTANEDEKLLPTILAALREKLPAAKRKTAELAELIDSVSVSLGAGPVKGTLTVKPGTVAAASAAKAFIRAFTTIAKSLLEGERRALSCSSMKSSLPTSRACVPSHKVGRSWRAIRRRRRRVCSVSDCPAARTTSRPRSRSANASTSSPCSASVNWVQRQPLSVPLRISA